MKLLASFTIYLFLCLNFSWAKSLELNFLVESGTLPGNEKIYKEIERLKGMSGTEEFVKYMEEKLVNGEIFTYPYSIKVNFKNKKPYKFIVKDLDLPTANAFFVHKTHSPMRYQVISDGINIKTKVKWTFKNEEDKPTVYEGVHEPTTSEFMKNYELLFNILEPIKDKVSSNKSIRFIKSSDKINLEFDDKNKNGNTFHSTINFSIDEEGDYILNYINRTSTTSIFKMKLNETKVLDDFDVDINEE